MKQVFLVLLFGSFTSLTGQEISEKNQFSVGLQLSQVTFGDRIGFHYINTYNRLISKRFSLGFTLGYLSSISESSILNDGVPSNYTNNIATGNWGVTSEDGIKILELKTDQQSYIHSDLTIGYRIIEVNSFGLKMNLGGSLVYVNSTYITRWELGTFNGLASGDWDLQLVYPYYSRVLDIGITVGIDLYYTIGNRFNVGLYAGGNTYPKSGYRFYDLGMKCGIKF
jgi:hypothetical protein